MNVFVAVFTDDAKDELNPFTYTLESQICDAHQNVMFSSRKSEFWNRDDWDIVHVMWPDSFVPAMREGRNLYDRLLDFKNKGVKIVSTIHNFWSHSHSSEEDYYYAYQIIYSMSDVMVHLGEYSKDKFEGLYRQAKHIVIPHHVYNTIYSEIPDKKNALAHLGYKDGVYVLVFGAFRHVEEKKLMFSVIKANPEIRFVIPRLYELPDGKINLRWLKQRLKHIYYKLKYPNLLCSGESFVSEEDIKYYYAATDVSFLPRMVNLNSGNLPLGMLMGHVIVGPDNGNIGELLQETGNFSYQFNNLTSICQALRDAIDSVASGVGKKNREYALKNWNTAQVAEKYYQIYKALCPQH